MVFTIRIPSGGNEIFNKLKELVGEPIKTERIPMGLSAARLDYFSCGCVRTYTASMLRGTAEAKEDLRPCSQHGGLAPSPAKPESVREAPTVRQRSKKVDGQRQLF